MLKSLLWKEWREARWKAAFGAVLLAGACAVHLQTRMMPDEMAFMFIIGLGGVMLPLLAAIGAVGADREAASLYFLQALPIRPWRILAFKLVVALGVALVPLLAGWGVCVAMAGGREVSTKMFTTISLFSLWIALQVIVWTVAFGMRQPTEARVGLAGLFVIIAWSVWTVLPLNLYPCLTLAQRLADHSYRVLFFFSPVAQGLELAVLFVWAARRFKSLRRSRA